MSATFGLTLFSAQNNIPPQFNKWMLVKEDIDMLRALVKEGITPIKDIAARFGVSRATVYRLAPTNGKS